MGVSDEPLFDAYDHDVKLPGESSGEEIWVRGVKRVESLKGFQATGTGIFEQLVMTIVGVLWEALVVQRSKTWKIGILLIKRNGLDARMKVVYREKVGNDKQSMHDRIQEIVITINSKGIDFFRSK